MVLAGICEELVRLREQLESDRMGELYAATLVSLTEADPGAAALALAAKPEQYAAKLAQRVTGSPVVAPPAALTPEGVAKGHEQARELAVDLRARRKRSVQSMIGRAQLTPEQADKLLAGSNASRILDMLLTLPSSADRLASPAAMAAPSLESDAEELVWCTPSQLLVELEARLQRLEGRGPRPAPVGEAGPQLLAAPGVHSLTGEALLGELRLLREEVRRRWLDSLEAK
ncbi:hypothetical protein PLESTM_001007700 [Pleodorina starrii]|nr:hypothetical protein PLESTM_001007700 [Pleodorina starrii]